MGQYDRSKKERRGAESENDYAYEPKETKQKSKEQSRDHGRGERVSS